MLPGWHASWVYAVVYVVMLGVYIFMLLCCRIQSAMTSPYAEGVFLDAEGAFLHARAICSELR